MTKTYRAGMASNIDSFADAPPPAGTPPKLFFYYMYVTYETLVADPTFVISYVDANNRPRAAAQGPLPNLLEITQRDLFPKLPGNPTFSTILRCEPLPGSLVRVEVTAPGAVPSEDFDFGPPVNGATARLAPKAELPPRLCLALNTTFVAKPTVAGDFSAPGPAEVTAILAHIHARLFEGPSAAWTGPDGVPQLTFGGSPRDALEEEWAKRYTEMMLAMPYAVPEVHYAHGDDKRYYQRYIQETDPGYAICAECQHLVTYAYLTRGIHAIKGEDPVMFTAGDGSFANVDGKNKRLDGFKIDPSNAGTIDAVIEKLTPGSSYVYNGKPPGSDVFVGNQGVAHIGFVLRVDKQGHRIQTFDTGGLNAPGRAATLGAPISDDPWLTRGEHVIGPNPSSDAKFMGVCVLPNATEAELKAGVDKLKRARPIGFARLILMKRTAVEKMKSKANIAADDIIFMTPYLRMHFEGAPTPAAPFTFAAYLWSMREHPGADQIAAIWSFSVPRESLARMMVFGKTKTSDPPKETRPMTIAQLVEASGGLGLSGGPHHRDPKPALPQTFGCLDLMSNADGTVSQMRRWNASPKTHDWEPNPRPLLLTRHWGEASGTVKLTSADLATTPYFRSEG